MVKIFISYSHKDETYKERFVVSMAVLKRLKIIELWEDGGIIPGTLWNDDIFGHLRSADIVVCLISDDFINSDFCVSKELEDALARHSRGEVLIVPVLVRPTAHFRLFEDLSKFQALPKGAKPVSSWDNADEAWTNVAENLHRSIEYVQQKKA